MKTVKVTWNDISTITGKISHRRAKKMKPLVMESVGILLFKNKDFVCIAKEWNAETKLYRGFSIIPNEAIVKVDELKKKAK